MSYSLYREFLTEEEKFLKQLERNIQDQINRLKVEELSLLKLISSSDPSQYAHQNTAQLTDDSPLFSVTTPANEDEDSSADGDDDLSLALLSQKLLSPKKEDTDSMRIPESHDASPDADNLNKSSSVASKNVPLNELSVNEIPLEFGSTENTNKSNDQHDKLDSVIQEEEEEEEEEENEED